MRGLLVTFSVAVIVAMAAAQPWQWEEMGDDVYRPSGFPAEFSSWGMFTQTAGDFDGDGVDEFFSDEGDRWVVGQLASTNPLHWTTIVGEQDLSPGNTIGAAESINLDDDNRDELIVIGDEVHCWKLLGTDPWTWEQVDYLLTELYFPESARKVTIGDFDGDGLLNEVIAMGDWDETVFYERGPDGNWYADSAWAWTLGGAFFDGDFDNDGDEDFAAIQYLLNLDDEMPVFHENTGSGIAAHWFNAGTIAGPTGGDIDGDGLWEFLSFSNEGPMHFNPLGYHLIDVVPEPEEFLQITGTRSLGRPEGIIEGKVRTPSGQKFIASLYMGGSYRCGWSDCFEMVVRSEWQWDFHDAGLFHTNATAGRISFGTLNAGDQQDLLMVVRGPYPEQLERWETYRNIGTDTTDLFLNMGTLSLPTHGDPAYFSPQLCQVIGGNELSELAALEITGNDTGRVRFYRLANGIDVTPLDELDAGLEDARFDAIRMADLDGDGSSELIGRTATEWQSWFLRNGRWDRYENILPEFGLDDVSFVDYDDDGDLDLFTRDDVWLSLSPSAVEEPVTPVVAELTLGVYPNPFNSGTTISLTVARTGRYSLEVFNVLGERVRTLVNGKVAAGAHELSFDGSELPSGLYFAALSGEGARLTQKLLLVK